MRKYTLILLFTTISIFLVLSSKGQFIDYDKDFYSLFYNGPEDFETIISKKGFTLTDQLRNKPENKMATLIFEKGNEMIMVAYFDSVQWKAAKLTYITPNKEAFDLLKSSYKNYHTRLDTEIQKDCTLFWGFCYEMSDKTIDLPTEGEWLDSKFKICQNIVAGKKQIEYIISLSIKSYPLR